MLEVRTARMSGGKRPNGGRPRNLTPPIRNLRGVLACNTGDLPIYTLIMTYLAVPIGSKSTDEAAEQIKAAKKAGAEMLELRTDYLAGLDVEKMRTVLAAAKKTSLPVIVTCRDKAQGGAAVLPSQLRTRILVEAIGAGADFVDCEFDNFVLSDTNEKITAALNEHDGVGLILSAHRFEGPFSNTAGVYEEIVRTE